MKVLYIVSWYSDYQADKITTGIFHYEQAMSLKKVCDVALYYPYDKSIDVKFTKEIESNLTVYRTKWRKNKIIRLLSWLIDFYKIRKEFSPDIIHSHVAISAGVLALFINKVFHIPYVVSEHAPIELSNLNVKKIYKRNYLVYKNSRLNFGVSDYLTKELKIKFPGCSFQTLYNGVPIYKINLQHTYIYKKEGFYNIAIVAAMYDKEIKGFQYLFPALNILNNNGIHVFLHICGDGQYLDYFKDLARKEMVYDDCIFYGYCARDKVFTVISEMDFVISTSLFESAGVNVQESLLLGKPVLVTKSGGANSLVSDYNSVVIEKGSSEAIVNGVKDMINKLQSFDSDKIQRKAKELFDIDEISKKSIKIYQEILK